LLPHILPPLPFFFFFTPPYTSDIYTLSLHDALPICPSGSSVLGATCGVEITPRFIRVGLSKRHKSSLRPSKRMVLDEFTTGTLRSEEHTSELQSRFDLVCRLLLEKKK